MPTKRKPARRKSPRKTTATKARRPAAAKRSRLKRKVANPRGVRKDADALFRIRREPLDSGGYTRGRSGGRYFGTGALLFVVETPDGDQHHVRGSDRYDAMASFRSHYGYKYPDAKFFGEKRPRESAMETADEYGSFPSASLDGNMGPATQAKLKALVKARSPAQYRIEAHDNSEDAKVLRRRGVESSGRGEHGRNLYLIPKARLPRLLIAMLRGRDDEQDLASSMLTALDIEVV